MGFRQLVSNRNQRTSFKTFSTLKMLRQGDYEMNNTAAFFEDI